MKFIVPEKYYFRIHHIRPRFKNDVESVLLYIADAINQIGIADTKKFNEKLIGAIYSYPGNAHKKIKTINNWRTEISSLFGLIEFGESNAYPSRLTKKLASNEDLIQFFRYFLSSFCYPGGHLKSQEIKKIIQEKVKFHPAKSLIELAIFATKKSNGERFGISKSEATHHLFNDLRVTRGNVGSKKIYENIIFSRDCKHEYDSSGDVVRYAGDILDYLVLADLFDQKLDGKYYPKMQNLNAMKAILESEPFYEIYDHLYEQKELNISEISELKNVWLKKINEDITDNKFDTDIDSLLDYEEIKESADVSILKSLATEITSKAVTTKKIGDYGEAITIEHEKNRIKRLGREDLIHKILKLPENLAMGYDIKSFLGENEEFSNIHIEVKTTISKNKLRVHSFTLTKNEFDVAQSYRESYYIYRLLISSSEFKLFVIKDPIGKFKQDKVKLSVSDGARITYTDESGDWHKVLI